MIETSPAQLSEALAYASLIVEDLSSDQIIVHTIKRIIL